MAEQRIVVITGGGTGIGKAAAHLFAQKGDRVVILGRRHRVLEQTADEIARAAPGARIWARTCDVSVPDQVDAFVAWLRSDVGEIVDVLVNNAGGTGSIERDASTTEAAEYAHRMLATNLVGTYLMIHALYPYLRRPGGSIVNISSIAAVRGGGDMYSAAKAGVIGLTYSLAGELGPEGITVNSIAPGLTLDTEFFGDRMTDERLQRTVAQTPLGRPGHPEDIAAAIDYLASPEASFVTGQVLHVNGGWVFGR